MCRRDLGLKVPKLIKVLDGKNILNLDGCTYLFEWQTDFACKNCIKSQIEYYLSPCKNNLHTYTYLENFDCLIFRLDEPYNKFNGDISDVKIKISDKIIMEYMWYNKGNRRLDQWNSSLSDSTIYAENFHEQENCNPLNQVDETTFIIILCIPIVYFITMIILCLVCCKYRKVKNEYEKLNSKENQTVMGNSEKKIEL